MIRTVQQGVQRMTTRAILRLQAPLAGAGNQELKDIEDYWGWANDVASCVGQFRSDHDLWENERLGAVHLELQAAASDIWRLHGNAIHDWLGASGAFKKPSAEEQFIYLNRLQTAVVETRQIIKRVEETIRQLPNVIPENQLRIMGIVVE